MSEDGNASDIGAFLAGFVIGGLVGAATALIMAPQSGAETRAQIAAKGEELRRAGEEQFTEYRENIGSAVTEAKGRVQEGSGQIQERARIVLDEGMSKVSKSAEKAQDTIVEAQEEIVEQSSQEDAAS
jgi:gas vesicle protein